MIDTDLLIQTLIAAGGDESLGVQLDDEQYLDWSTEGDNDGPRLEVVDVDGGRAVIDLSRDGVERIHRGLTLWLLTHPA